MEKKTDEQLSEKFNDIVMDCVNNSLVPMEHTITVKFITKTPMKMDELEDDKWSEKMRELLKEETDSVGEAIDKWIDENINNNEKRAIGKLSYTTEPYGLRESFCKNRLKKALTSLAKSL